MSNNIATIRRKAWSTIRNMKAGIPKGSYGETPYHPKKKPKRPKPHPAMTVPGRLMLNERPAGAQKRSRFGHYEMDTIVSSTSGRGGLLVLIDRKSRRYVIELLAHVTQDDVVVALKRMISRNAISNVISITTDNGCEFLDPNKIKSVVGCNVYYTPAYFLRGRRVSRFVSLGVGLKNTSRSRSANGSKDSVMTP